jgi:hypothetical protein
MAASIGFNPTYGIVGGGCDSANNYLKVISTIVVLSSTLLLYNVTRKPAQHIHVKKVDMNSQEASLTRKIFESLIMGAATAAGFFVAKEGLDFIKNLIKHKPLPIGGVKNGFYV